MGRFLSPDWSAKEEPVPYAKLDDPQTLNLYSYVQNNPLSRVDKDGHIAGVDDAVEAGIVITIGVIATVQAINTVEHMPSGSFSDFTSSVASNFKSDVHSITSMFSKGAKGIPKAANAPGVTAGGQATDQYGNKLGPSGDPQVNKTKSNTREAARNKALNEGSGATEHKADGKSDPHFHPTDAQGEKKPTSTHHEYPDR